MQIPNTKIEAICSNPKKDPRAYLTAPYLDVENKRLIATNGHALVIYPVEPSEGDTSGHVPIEALKRARSRQGNYDLQLNGTAKTAGVTFPRPDDLGKFPDIDKVVPPKPDTPPTVVLDAALLAKLAGALSDRRSIVRLWIPEHDGPIRVESTDSAAVGVGVLMPCRRDS